MTGVRLVIGAVAGSVACTVALTAGCSQKGDTASSVGSSSGPATAHTDGSLGGTTYPVGDARITSCFPSGAGRAGATVVVINHSEITSDYLIDVRLVAKGSGSEIGTGDAAVVNLPAGHASRPLAIDGDTPAPTGGYTCRLAQVNKFVSAG